MGYVLTSQATGETLPLSAREWEMIRALAAQPPGWDPKGDRDYTGGRIPTDEASVMAESVKGQLRYLSRAHSVEQAGEARTVPELRESLGHVQGDSRTFFGDDARRRKGEDFVRLASAGAFEVLPRRSEEEG